MPLFNRAFRRDNGLLLEIDGSFDIVDDAVQVERYTAWRWVDRNNPDARSITLTNVEADRLCQELSDDPTSWEIPDGIPG